MLTPASSYDALTAGFAWRIPARYNIGTDVIDRWADGSGRLALTVVEGDGGIARYSFDALKTLSDRLANVLVGVGTRRGDRIGILLSQSVECGLAHGAAYKAGMIAVPLFALFGEEALEFRLADSGAAVLVTDSAGWAKVAPIRDRLPALRTVLLTDVAEPAPAGTIGFWPALEAASASFTAVETAADDPAVIIYTSGTTGQPKGALHAHRVLLGHLPGVELPQNFFHTDPARDPEDHFWTPADWAWIGGLLDVLLPAWHHGMAVLAHRMAKFDPEHAFALMRRHRVRHSFLPPTALKLMRQAPTRRIEGVRSVGSGGETLGAELLDWGREAFGLTINEFYGQTECNLIVANSADLFTVRPGSMGRPVPGHDVAILDEAGQRLGLGRFGSIGVRAVADPVMFLRYWNNDSATHAKFVDGPDGRFLLTGDMGEADDDGYLWFTGRDDDVITSAGYRIGPGEIEDCLMRHPAVALAAVVGVPDPLRTQAVKAVIVPADGVAADDALASELQGFVKARLGAHEYPRIVDFADSLPMTPTGKIKRRDLRG